MNSPHPLRPGAGRTRKGRVTDDQAAELERLSVLFDKAVPDVKTSESAEIALTHLRAQYRTRKGRGMV